MTNVNTKTNSVTVCTMELYVDYDVFNEKNLVPPAMVQAYNSYCKEWANVEGVKFIYGQIMYENNFMCNDGITLSVSVMGEDDDLDCTTMYNGCDFMLSQAEENALILNMLVEADVIHK